MAGMRSETQGSDDAPAVVLLHGGIGAGRYHWSKQVDALAARFCVHLPDLPGHGRTPLPDEGEYSRDLLAGAVADYLERVGAPAHVAGFSLGGHTILALAVKRPELLSSLVLVGVSIRDHDGLHGWRDRFDPDTLAQAYPMWARSLSRLHEPLGGPDAWREVCRRDSAGDLGVDVDLDALGRVDVPVLLVRGDRDPAVDPQQYAELRALWPHADELVVPAGGHDVQLTRHDLVRPAILDFYERNDAA